MAFVVLLQVGLLCLTWPGYRWISSVGDLIFCFRKAHFFCKEASFSHDPCVEKVYAAFTLHAQARFVLKFDALLCAVPMSLGACLL